MDVEAHRWWLEAVGDTAVIYKDRWQRSDIINLIQSHHPQAIISSVYNRVTLPNGRRIFLCDHEDKVRGLRARIVRL